MADFKWSPCQNYVKLQKYNIFIKIFPKINLFHKKSIIILQNGVTFESPVDKSKMLLRPEDSMKIQN